MIHCTLEICVGCRMCEVACSSFHFGAVSPALSRIRVAKLEEIGLDMAVACLSCEEKPCLECPTEALSLQADGTILLDPEDCTACGVCVEECPVGAVGFHDDLPLFCDLCGGETSCVRACPSGALAYREEYKDVPLEPFLESTGRPPERRARFAGSRGEPIRERWKNGARVDS